MSALSVVIVSYDGTPNDDDALVLGRALAGAGPLALAYVRHSRELDPRREELARHDAERRLRSGADLLGSPEVSTHVRFSASTADGLRELAGELDAGLVVFGSDYRTPPGRAEPPNTAQRLLDGGPVAVAVARAGLRLELERPVRTIAAAPDGEPAVAATVARLIERIGARSADPGDPALDLIVVGSQAGVAAGTVALGGRARAALDSARCSVLVLARDRPLRD